MKIKGATSHYVGDNYYVTFEDIDDPKTLFKFLDYMNGRISGNYFMSDDCLDDELGFVNYSLSKSYSRVDIRLHRKYEKKSEEALKDIQEDYDIELNNKEEIK